MKTTPRLKNLKPYPSYKDSGVPWLGKVPEQWTIVRLKRIARLAYGDSLTANERRESEIPVYGSNGLVGYHNQANTLAPVIIIGRKGSFGKIQYSTKPVFAIDTTFFIDKRYTDADLEWLFYMLLQLELDRFSQDSAVPGLDREEAYQKLTVLPPLPEQRAIVKFLDWVERRIRFIIAARKRRIQLLEEYRQALINDAVTGKFDVRTGKPYPSYKDSGVPWLGKVPEGWEIVRLKRITRLAYGDSLPAIERQKGEVPVYGSNGPVGSHNRANTAAPVIIIGRKGSFGKIQYSDERVFAIDTTFFIDKRYTDADLRWLFYMLSQLELDRSSQDSAVPGLDREEAYQRLTVLPPPPEQRAIAEYLDRETAKIDAAIEKTKESIALWEELRETLISDVVTGKLDVREAAKKLPEAEPELEAKLEALEAALREQGEAPEPAEPEDQPEEAPA